MEQKQKARIIKANKELQARVGSGPLDEKKVAECERIIEENQIDFQPMAQDFLAKLDAAVKKARSGSVTKEQAVQDMTQPVMELKANAAVFKYNLIGSLANIMLSFLESIKQMDKEAVEIVEAHHKTLSIIVAKKMTGDGGAHGRQFEEELKSACKRYFARNRAP